jgi:DNA-binding IclR family transcriptional regulator
VKVTMRGARRVCRIGCALFDHEGTPRLVLTVLVHQHSDLRYRGATVHKLLEVTRGISSEIGGISTD